MVSHMYAWLQFTFLPGRDNHFVCALALEGACLGIMPHNEPNVYDVYESNTLDYDNYTMVQLSTECN